MKCFLALILILSIGCHKSRVNTEAQDPVFLELNSQLKDAQSKTEELSKKLDKAKEDFKKKSSPAEKSAANNEMAKMRRELALANENFLYLQIRANKWAKMVRVRVYAKSSPRDRHPSAEQSASEYQLAWLVVNRRLRSAPRTWKKSGEEKREAEAPTPASSH